MRIPSLSRARAALSRRAATSASFTRASAARFASDFDHHAPGIARLNHGSFGATPAPVLAATEACRARWLAQPDDEYFSGALDAELQAATAAAADAIGAPAAETALVENATVAAAIVFRRWSQPVWNQPVSRAHDNSSLESFLGAPSSGEEPTPPRYRAAVASMAERAVNLISTQVLAFDAFAKIRKKLDVTAVQE